MPEDFDALPWHDATLVELKIDRRTPGTQDEVRLSIVWPNDETSIVRFQGCYAFEAKMNFGIVANESIMCASVDSDDQGLAEAIGLWKRFGVSLDALRCFRIECNSTASVIKIYALRFEIIVGTLS